MFKRASKWVSMCVCKPFVCKPFVRKCGGCAQEKRAYQDSLRFALHFDVTFPAADNRRSDGVDVSIQFKSPRVSGSAFYLPMYVFYGPLGKKNILMQFSNLHDDSAKP